MQPPLRLEFYIRIVLQLHQTIPYVLDVLLLLQILQRLLHAFLTRLPLLQKSRLQMLLLLPHWNKL